MNIIFQVDMDLLGTCLVTLYSLRLIILFPKGTNQKLISFFIKLKSWCMYTLHTCKYSIYMCWWIFIQFMVSLSDDSLFFSLNKACGWWVMLLRGITLRSKKDRYDVLKRPTFAPMKYWLLLLASLVLINLGRLTIHYYLFWREIICFCLLV